MKSNLNKLSDKQRLRIQTRHRVSVERYGYQPQALYWSNREIQEIRFQKLMEILPPANQLNHQAWSLLDVGCGFADFSEFLKKHDYLPEYTGIDISPEMVLGAKSMHSDSVIKEGELSDFDFKPSQFDYVMLSGALNEVVETEIEGTHEQQGEYAKSVIKTMYSISRQGVAFNLLNARDTWVNSRYDLQSFLPEHIVEYCQGFANHVELIEGYLENDFTIYLRKSLR